MNETEQPCQDCSEEARALPKGLQRYLTILGAITAEGVSPDVAARVACDVWATSVPRTCEVFNR